MAEPPDSLASETAAAREEVRSFSKASNPSKDVKDGELRLSSGELRLSREKDVKDGELRLSSGELRLSREKEAAKSHKKKQAARRGAKLINMEAADKRSLSNMMNTRGFHHIVASPSQDGSYGSHGLHGVAGSTVNDIECVSSRSSRRPSSCSHLDFTQQRRPSNISSLPDWSTDAPSVVPSPRQSLRKDPLNATLPGLTSIEDALQHAFQTAGPGQQPQADGSPQDMSRLAKARGFAIKTVSSDRFNFLIGTLIIVSMALMGIELDTAGSGSDVMFSLLVLPQVPNLVFSFFELLFFLIFGSELFLRVLAQPIFAARALNTYIDAAALCPYVLQLVFNLDDGRHFILLRLVRLLRLCRVSRLIRVFKELRFLVKSIMSAMKMLVWIGLLLFILVYCAAIFCTTMIGQNSDFEESNNLIQRYEAAHGVEADVQRNWGNTSRSMLTLFQIFTLDDWGQFVRPVLETHQPWMIVFFVLFIFLTTFGLLNLLMGAIVDHTMSVHRQAALDRERLLEEEYKQTMLAAARLFTLVDTEKKGTISAEELEEFLRENDIRDALEAELRQFNLSIDYDMLGDAWSDAAAVFHTIHDEFDGESESEDAECTRGICMEEFVGLAMRLQGQARSRDLLATLIEAKAAVLRIHQVDESLDDLHRKVDAQGRRIEDSFRLLKSLNLGASASAGEGKDKSGSDDDSSVDGHHVSSMASGRQSRASARSARSSCKSRSQSHGSAPPTCTFELERPKSRDRASISVSHVEDNMEVRRVDLCPSSPLFSQGTRASAPDFSAASKLLGEGTSSSPAARRKKRGSATARSRSSSSSDQEVTNLAIPQIPSRTASRHNSINRRPSMADREMLAAGATRQLAATLKSINKDATFAAMETTKVLNSYSELNNSNDKPAQRRLIKKGNSMSQMQRDSMASEASEQTVGTSSQGVGSKLGLIVDAAGRRRKRNFTSDMSDSFFRSLALVRDSALHGTSGTSERKPSVSVNGPVDEGTSAGAANKDGSSASGSPMAKSSEALQFGTLPNYVTPA